MATYGKRVKDGGGYIRTAIKGRFATLQVTSEGEAYIASIGVSRGGKIDHGDIEYLRSHGMAYFGGGGLGGLTNEPGELLSPNPVSTNIDYQPEGQYRILSRNSDPSSIASKKGNFWGEPSASPDGRFHGFTEADKHQDQNFTRDRDRASRLADDPPFCLPPLSTLDQKWRGSEGFREKSRRLESERRRIESELRAADFEPDSLRRAIRPDCNPTSADFGRGVRCAVGVSFLVMAFTFLIFVIMVLFGSSDENTRLMLVVMVTLAVSAAISTVVICS